MSLNDEDRCEELENIIDDLESYANDLKGLSKSFTSKDIKGDIKDIVTEINAVKDKYIEEKETVEERPTLRFACCEWLLNQLLECGVERKNIDVLKIGTRYDYKLFKVVPIKLYHDVPQCGYRVLFDDYKVIYMTDTKTVEGITAKD